MTSAAGQGTDRPQLHMVHDLRRIPDPQLPDGYRMRSLRPHDLPAWAALLNRNGELGEWPRSRAEPLFADNSPMPLRSSFVAISDDELVATAQLHRHTGIDPYAPAPELGWVAVLPQHRGHRLARAVCAAVLDAARQGGARSMFLKTDDARLPAIRTYLNLGFTPWMRDDSAAGRWDAVLAALAGS